MHIPAVKHTPGVHGLLFGYPMQVDVIMIVLVSVVDSKWFCVDDFVVIFEVMLLCMANVAVEELRFVRVLGVALVVIEGLLGVCAIAVVGIEVVCEAEDDTLIMPVLDDRSAVVVDESIDGVSVAECEVDVDCA